MNTRSVGSPTRKPSEMVMATKPGVKRYRLMTVRKIIEKRISPIKKAVTASASLDDRDRTQFRKIPNPKDTQASENSISPTNAPSKSSV